MALIKGQTGKAGTTDQGAEEEDPKAFNAGLPLNQADGKGALFGPERLCNVIRRPSERCADFTQIGADLVQQAQKG